jgi:hypothetical protein
MKTSGAAATKDANCKDYCTSGNNTLVETSGYLLKFFKEKAEREIASSKRERIDSQTKDTTPARK